MKKPVLVVMAAGMGSRYGGLKQIDPVGPCGETILDYSIYDAIEAGFESVVLIIKASIQSYFSEVIEKRLSDAPIKISYAYQEIDNLPSGYPLQEERIKPWGTGHAVLCAKEAIDGAPFAVINADDYYGKSAFKAIYTYLSDESEHNANDYCMVGYALNKTVTDHGYVSRGICEIDPEGYLTEVVERTRIECLKDGIYFTDDQGDTWNHLPDHTIVSMNLWGFKSNFLEEASEGFKRFLETDLKSNPLRAEYFLPSIVADLIHKNRARVKVLSTGEKWYGVTYAEDKEIVKNALVTLIEEGMYPQSLWGHK